MAQLEFIGSFATLFGAQFMQLIIHSSLDHLLKNVAIRGVFSEDDDAGSIRWKQMLGHIAIILLKVFWCVTRRDDLLAKHG